MRWRFLPLWLLTIIGLLLFGMVAGLVLLAAWLMFQGGPR
jgi:hypothetical protein